MSSSRNLLLPAQPLQKQARGDRVIAAVTILFGLFLAGRYHMMIWETGADGLSVVSHGTPYWDFSNLWSGSRMALDGHIAFLFDMNAYRAALRDLFSPLLRNQEWSYPPSMLLIGAPLAMLPVLPAYWVWTLGTAGLLFLAMRGLRMPLHARLAVLLSPSVLINAVFGQNGSLTSALLVSGLLLVTTRPVLAGVLIGLLTIKPHLGLLLPFCLLAAGAYRAVASAAVTALAMAVLTGILFGFEVWPLFLEKTAPLMSGIMEAPYPQSYHANALTHFIMARWLGFSLAASYAWQGAVTLLAIAAVIWLWRPQRQVDHGARVCVTALLVLLATPYGYTYDSVPLAVAAAYFFVRRTPIPVAILAIVWLYPLLVHLLHANGIGATILFPTVFAIWSFALLWRDDRSFKACATPLSG